MAATLVQIIHATRSTFTEGWSGPIEASLWLFDGKNKLTSPVAVVEDGDEVTNAFRRKIFLQYGMGIAGRAFKTNRPRVYVYVPPEDAQKDEPDYYIPLEGTPAHKVLVALPIHLPVSKQVFTRHPSIYESKVPYGVLCLGSEFAECPLAQLRLPEEIKKLIVFQHSMYM